VPKRMGGPMVIRIPPVQRSNDEPGVSDSLHAWL
jgi:hypothetical protein